MARMPHGKTAQSTYRVQVLDHALEILRVLGESESDRSLAELCATQETVHLCILDEGEILYLEKLEPQRSVRLASRAGRRVPAYCTSVGKAILAELPEAEVDAIVRRSGLKRITPNTITTPAALKEELRKIRTKGYSIDEEENE